MFLLNLITSLTMTALAQTNPQISGVLEKLEQLTKTRDQLAMTLVTSKVTPKEVTPEVFKAVCSPIGQELNRWSKEMGYQARQLSHKARNPKNLLSPQDPKLVTFLNSSKTPPDYVTQEEIWESQKGTSLIKPIYITEGCLVCHGAQAKIPPFIKSKYPKDQALDFKIGELRGIFWVWLPDSKK